MLDRRRSRKHVRQKKRRKEVWKLRLSGLSQTQIAERLGCDQSTVSEDLKICFEEYNKQYQSEAVEFAKHDLARLDELLVANWDEAISGDKSACQLCLKILERRSKLLGLDAAVKVQVEQGDETPEELRAKLAAAIDAAMKP